VGTIGSIAFIRRRSARAHPYKRSVSTSDNLASWWISVYCGNGISRFLTAVAMSASSSCLRLNVY
jgi:hypothetical protein